MNVKIKREFCPENVFVLETMLSWFCRAKDFVYVRMYFFLFIDAYFLETQVPATYPMTESVIFTTCTTSYATVMFSLLAYHALHSN